MIELMNSTVVRIIKDASIHKRKLDTIVNGDEPVDEEKDRDMTVLDN